MGVLLGALAHFVSTFMYFFVLFSLGIAVVSVVGYLKLVEFAKVRQPVLCAIFGAIMGMLIVVAYHYVPYAVARREFVAAAQKAYQVDAAGASRGFDALLRQETGAEGFVGYMILRAREGEEYVFFVVHNGMVIDESRLTLKSPWIWLYWLLEAVIITVPTAWIGHAAGGLPFSESSNDWYASPESLIGTVDLARKEEFLLRLRMGDLHGAGELILYEGEIVHPTLELRTKQTTGRAKREVLLTITQTHRPGRGYIQRNTLSQWEISPEELVSLIGSSIPEQGRA